MARQAIGVLAMGLALLLLAPATRLEAGEAYDKAIRALSGADVKPTLAIPALAPHRAQPASPNAERAYTAYLKTIEGKLTAKARELGPPRYLGKVVVCFNIGHDGRVSNRDLCMKSGNPDGDRFALAVVEAVGPLPPPPPSTATTGGVVWVYSAADEPQRKNDISKRR